MVQFRISSVYFRTLWAIAPSSSLVDAIPEGVPEGVTPDAPEAEILRRIDDGRLQSRGTGLSYTWYDGAQTIAHRTIDFKVYIYPSDKGKKEYAERRARIRARRRALQQGMETAREAAAKFIARGGRLRHFPGQRGGVYYWGDTRVPARGLESMVGTSPDHDGWLHVPPVGSRRQRRDPLWFDLHCAG